jgi:16S rRNA (guanine527-N7)-methyltransferase
VSAALADLALVARAVGATLSPDALERFERYLELLVAWNRAQRLTSLRQRSQIVRGLFADSLLFLKVLPARRPLRVVDIGAGAGIPGIPLRIIDPGLSVTLIEAKRKRVSFLKTVARQLSLQGDLDIVEGRAEQVLADGTYGFPPNYDIAIARAAMPIGKLIPLGLGYLWLGGELIVSGPPMLGKQPESIPGLAWKVAEVPELGLARTFGVVRKE